MGTLYHGDNPDTHGNRLRFVSGSGPECARPRAQRQESTDQRPETARAEDKADLAAAGDGRTPSGVSLVRIIGEPTAPREASIQAEDEKFQSGRPWDADSRSG
jgi:hypothetical protein